MTNQEMEILPKSLVTVQEHKKTKKSVVMTKKLIEKFLDELKWAERSETTIDSYRRNLCAFYEFLPEDKRLKSTSLLSWQNHLMQQGYANASVNNKISTVNSFFNYLGVRNWQITSVEGICRSEERGLSRDKYRRMLCEAKRQGDIQLYLILKTITWTELTPGDLIFLTRESVNKGTVTGKIRGVEKEIQLPVLLRNELETYAVYRAIHKGPIFLSGNGKPLTRYNITRMIRLLGEDINIGQGKATARNLHRLYLDTLAELQKQADMWVAESYIHLLESEEQEVGWEIYLKE